MSEMRDGGCLCGAVRYKMTWPPKTLATCSCTHCQKQAGSALTVIAMTNVADLELTGELSTYHDHGETGGDVYRKFCPKCGSPIVTELPLTKQDGTIFVKAGTLDDVSDLQPGIHFWTGSAQPWVTFPEGAMQLEKQG